MRRCISLEGQRVFKIKVYSSMATVLLEYTTKFNLAVRISLGIITCVDKWRTTAPWRHIYALATMCIVTVSKYPQKCKIHFKACLIICNQ